MELIDDRNLTQAILMALQMWSDERYLRFLTGTKKSEIDAEWFRWFVGKWGVARTIGKDFKVSVRTYLGDEFRQALDRGGRGDAVDEAALHLKQQKWSSRMQLPISLVSKVGFFLCPLELVPRDSYALKGLKTLRRMSGASRETEQSYSEYLTAFNSLFTEMEPHIATGLKEPWVGSLAKKLGCRKFNASSPATQRKILDNYLMLTGGYPWS